MIYKIRKTISRIAIGLLLLNLSGWAYADDTTTAGIVGALGLTAGSGKTSLGDGAGSIEASLIQTQAINEAGWIITKLIQPFENGHTVILLSKSDTTDLSSVESMKLNISALQANFPTIGKDGKFEIACDDAVAKPADHAGAANGKFHSDFLGLGAAGPAIAKSLPTILATDTSVAKVEVDEDDRVLIDSIMMNDGASKFAAKWQSATTAGTSTPAAAALVAFVLPSEVIRANPDTSAVYAAFKDLQQKVARGQKCSNSTWKAAISAATAFITTVTTVGDKATASPLILILEQEAYAIASNDVLRVSIESTGGTSITRSGVLYTLGLPNAAIITSGLVVSFRLVNPAKGRAKLTGVVRCAAKPINFKKVQAAPDKNLEGVTCSYLSNGPSNALASASG